MSNRSDNIYIVYRIIILRIYISMRTDEFMGINSNN